MPTMTLPRLIHSFEDCEFLLSTPERERGCSDQRRSFARRPLSLSLPDDYVLLVSIEADYARTRPRAGRS